MKLRSDNIEKVIVVADRGLNCSDNMIKMAGIDLDKENKENVLIETKVKTTKRAFKVVEVSENTIKPKKIVKPRSKKKESTVVNE